MKKLFAVFLALLMTSFAAYASEETHTHCVCGDTACTEKHEDTGSVTWHAWDGGTAAGTVSDTSKTAVYLYLENDIEIQDTFNITNVTVYLCLNGKTLTINKEGYPAVRVGEGQKFVLCDCTGTGKITGAKGSAANDTTRFGAVNCQAGSSFIMYGGSISDNTVENSNGGGVFVNGGTFVMHGGFISNNKAPNGSGGAVSVENGKIYTDGGEMNGNSAINGGAIHIKGSTTTEIQKIKVNDNTAANMGGAVYAETSKNIKIDGAELGGNNAAKGGGIYVKYLADSVHTNIYNTDIHDNNALVEHGGGIYIDGNEKKYVSANMYDCELRRNTAVSNGGGMYAYSDENVLNINLFGGNFIGNSCGGEGGAVRVAGWDVCFGICSHENPLYIKENKAKNGAGIYVNSDAFKIIGKCVIEGNTAESFGGGMYIGGSYYNGLILTNVTAAKNTAAKGGGIYLNYNIKSYSKALEIGVGTTITENTSSADGSANNFYLNSGKKFQFRSGISGNERIGISLSETPTVENPIEIERVFSANSHANGDHSSLIIPDSDDYTVIYENDSHKIVPCYTVTADPGNGGEVQIIKVKCGDVLDPGLLITPERDDGYVFEDWYSNGVPYDFDKPVNENITLTAKWFNHNSTALDVTKDNIIVFNLDRPAVLFAASYNGSKLLDVKTLKLDKTEKKFITVNGTDINNGIQINTNNATKITVFLWEATDGSGITDMRPLCESSSADF